MLSRDRYKRVSRQLTAREQELLRQERELKRVTMEYQVKKQIF